MEDVKEEENREEVIQYVSYGGEHHLLLIMSLVDEQLSEPYSIFTYRYFVYLWPNLSFLGEMCKMGELHYQFYDLCMDEL